MRKKICMYNYKFYILTYNKGVFELVLLSEDKFPTTSLAKCHALSTFYNWGPLDVPVVSLGSEKFFFYHPRFRRWYEDLPDELLLRYFPWFDATAENSAYGNSLNSVGP